MNAFLRFVGITNAAIWFGSGIFFALCILPAVFSHDVRQIFGDSGATYYSGAVALVLFRHYFTLQYLCGAIALLHLLAQKFYSGRLLPRLDTALVIVIFMLGLIGGFWLQPHMESLRQTMYFGHSAEQKEHARHLFGLWHGLSETVNFFALIGLWAHLLRVTRAVGTSHQTAFYQIP